VTLISVECSLTIEIKQLSICFGVLEKFDTLICACGTVLRLSSVSLGVKWPGREADHSPPSSAEIKE
jgi:hypothetical protein